MSGIIIIPRARWNTRYYTTNVTRIEFLNHSLLFFFFIFCFTVVGGGCFVFCHGLIPTSRGAFHTHSFSPLDMTNYMYIIFWFQRGYKIGEIKRTIIKEKLRIFDFMIPSGNSYRGHCTTKCQRERHHHSTRIFTFNLHFANAYNGNGIESFRATILPTWIEINGKCTISSIVFRCDWFELFPFENVARIEGEYRSRRWWVVSGVKLRWLTDRCVCVSERIGRRYHQPSKLYLGFNSDLHTTIVQHSAPECGNKLPHVFSWRRHRLANISTPNSKFK